MSRQHPRDEIPLLLGAGYPLVLVVTREEGRARDLVARAAASDKRRFVEATAAANPLAALPADAAGTRDGGNAVHFVRDLHHHWHDPQVIRRLKDLSAVAHERRVSVITVAPTLQVPPDLEEDLSVVHLPLPAKAELGAIYDEVAQEGLGLPDNAQAREGYLRAGQGLAAEEARRVFRKAARSGAGVETVIHEKQKALRRIDALEYRELGETLDDIGGLDALKRWLEERTRAFSDDARRFGLPEPRGLFLTGVQGCGKSLVSKAIAGFWKMPLVRLDLAAVFGAPRPEDTLRSALIVAEAMAPCVLWIDEVEKGFDTSEGGGASRVLGVMVTWLQEKRAPVFAVATANRVDRLPPEFPRKGRFDDIFFIDLPQMHERRQIFQLHLAKRKRDPGGFDLDKLAKASDRFTGSEIEQAVISALYTAFSQSRELALSDLLNAVNDTVPLAETFDEEIKALRDWAMKRARHASIDRRKLDYFAS